MTAPAAHAAPTDEDLPRQSNLPTILLVVLVLCFGVVGTWATWRLTVRRLSADTLEQARLAARSLDIDRLGRLAGAKADLESPDYLRIKEQLIRIRTAHRRCRFLYLMAQRPNGDVVFLTDAQYPDSPDYAPPGLVYEEVSDDYLKAFKTRQEQVVGPVKDRWGTLVTSLVPISATDGEKLLAVLGMDIEADDWRHIVFIQCLLPIGLTLFIVILTLFIVLINRSRQNIEGQYAAKLKLVQELQEALQHVKLLQGILPICARCKKIRDNTGYWNQVEAYIRAHSQAEFTHGMCPDCEEEMYKGQKWYEQRKSNRGEQHEPTAPESPPNPRQDS